MPIKLCDFDIAVSLFSTVVGHFDITLVAAELILNQKHLDIVYQLYYMFCYQYHNMTDCLVVHVVLTCIVHVVIVLSSDLSHGILGFITSFFIFAKMYC